MRQSCSEVVSGAVEKNLGLIFEPAKGPGVDDPRPVALELGPISVARFRVLPAPRFTRFLGKRRQHARFVRFHLLAGLPTLAPGFAATSRLVRHAPKYS